MVRTKWWVAVVATVVYAAMWVGWRQDWGWLHSVDHAALNATHDIGVKHHGWVTFWQTLCTVFGPTALRVVGMVAVVAALVRRQLRSAVFLLVSIEMCELVTRLAKGLAQRPRPVTALVVEPSWSFPSGHAFTVMLAVLALLAVMRRASMPAMVVGATVVVLVGVGRVALNVHHPSDVLAGWALGYLYFLLCLRLVHPGRQR